VQIHFIQSKEFSETYVTSHAFQHISDRKIFPECVRGRWKRCGGPHAARRTVVGPHISRQLRFKCNNVYYNNAAGDEHINARQKMLNFECVNSNF